MENTVTINGTGTVANTPAIDRSNEQLIDNKTTFAELLRILASEPEVAEAAKEIAEERADEEKEKKLHEKLGADYDLVFGKTTSETQKPKRRPGAIQLRTSVPRIAAIEMSNGICEVYENGYAVYDNGDRKCVIWVPDCSIASYYFGALKENEKKYLPQHDEIDMSGFPWYNAVLIAGENRIEYNMDHPRSVGTVSDFDYEEVDVKPASAWIGAAHFDDPETAYLKKEAAEERRKALTEKQREVYVMYFEEGRTIDEISELVGINRYSVWNRIEAIQKKMRLNPEKFFSIDTPQNASEKPNR